MSILFRCDGSFIRETHREAMLYFKDGCSFKEKLGISSILLGINAILKSKVWRISDYEH